MKLPVLEICAVSYAINGQKIIEQISWQVGLNEHWAIIGPKGAGKTTLLKIICGYLWPNAGGSVKRLGQTLLDLRELRQSIGWVNYQHLLNIPAHEEVIDTVFAGKYAQVGLVKFRGENFSKLDYELANYYLEELALGYVADKKFGSLSQGEKQKVLLARARLLSPI